MCKSLLGDRHARTIKLPLWRRAGRRRRWGRRRWSARRPGRGWPSSALRVARAARASARASAEAASAARESREDELVEPSDKEREVREVLAAGEDRLGRRTYLMQWSDGTMAWSQRPRSVTTELAAALRRERDAYEAAVVENGDLSHHEG